MDELIYDQFLSVNTDYCDLLSPEQLREHEDDWFHPRDDVMKGI